MNKKQIHHLNKVQSLPNISTFRPKLKKNFSTNNISSTTNASVDKNINSNSNSSIIPSQNISQNSYNDPHKKIILHKIKLNNSKSQRSITKCWILPDSINTTKATLEIMQNADDIYRERLKNHDRDFAMRKHKLKSIALKVSKRVCRKNYLINSLKQRRTEVINKEFIIQKALKEFEFKLETDKKKFINFIEEVKEKQKKDETNLVDLKNIRFASEAKLGEEERKNKVLEQNIYKKIKELYMQKDFGVFVHKILETSFPYNDLPIIKSDHDSGKVAEEFIKLFSNMNNYEDTMKELEKTDIFFKKCVLMESKIIKGISEKETLEKEIIATKKICEKELKQLKYSKADYESDYNYLMSEIKRVKSEMKDFKLNDSEDFGIYLNFIQELGLEIDSTSEKPQSCDKKYLTEFVSYSKGIAEVLKKTEDKVNEMISNIENIIDSGNKKDKELILKLILNKKNINKKEKQLLFQRKEEELKLKQKLKIIERDKKVILKGRKVIYDYPINNKHNFTVKKSRETKKENNTNIQFEYSFSDEEEQND